MIALLGALAVTMALIAGSVYLVNVLWPVLPSWVMPILFVLLAVIVIGYPILSLARWSKRHPQHQRPGDSERPHTHDSYTNDDD